MLGVSASALIASRLPARQQDFLREVLLGGLSAAQQQEELGRLLRGPQIDESVFSRRAIDAAQRALQAWKEDGIQTLSIADADYPAALKTIHRPPLVLFYRGQCPSAADSDRCLAVVGSRKADTAGCEIAGAFSAGVVQAGGCVVSGLALGIDAAAHKGALKAGAAFPTVAVMGCGLRQVYPRANERLAAQILEQGGALITHFEPDEAPYPANFLDRNRIIAGLSSALLVVEAPLRSGSLVTARYGLEQGRDIMAVPGPINNDRWAGSNRLIKQGAYLVASIEEVIALMPALKKADTESGQPASEMIHGPAKARIIQMLHSSGELHFDSLAAELGGPQALQIDLLELEMEAVIVRMPGNLIRLAASSC